MLVFSNHNMCFNVLVVKGQRQMMTRLLNIGLKEMIQNIL